MRRKQEDGIFRLEFRHGPLNQRVACFALCIDQNCQRLTVWFHSFAPCLRSSCSQRLLRVARSCGSSAWPRWVISSPDGTARHKLVDNDVLWAMFFGTRCDREMRCGWLIEFDDQTMVALDAKWRREFLEQPLAIVRYARRPAVHRRTRAPRCRRKRSHTSVPEADPEEMGRDLKVRGQRRWYPASMACRYRHDHARLEVNKIGDADRAVPDHFPCLTKLEEIVKNVEGEGAVVVDDDNQDAPDV